MVSTSSADAKSSEQPTFWANYLAGVEGFTPPGIFLEVAKESGVDGTVTVESQSVDRNGLSDFPQCEAGDPVSAISLAVWSMLLGRYTGEKDTLFGFVPAKGKTVQDVRKTPLPVRLVNTSEDSPLAWLESTATYVDALAGLDADARRALSHDATEGKQSSVYSSFVVRCGSQDELASIAAEISSDTHATQLFFALIESAEGFELALAANRALSGNVLHRILQHCIRILDALVDQPALPFASDTILPPGEYDRVVHEWNATECHYNASHVLHEAIESQVARKPDAIALSMGDQVLTYSELNAQANQLAHYLRDCGVSDGSLVGVCMERSPEMVVSLIAVIKSGGAYVPLDPTYPSDRLALMLEDVDVPIILTQRRLEGVADFGEANVLLVDEMAKKLGEQPIDDLALDIDPDQLAYVIFTSGSTGRPKGAMNSHRAICNRLYWMQEKFGLDETDVVLQKTPFSFDVSVWEFFWPFMTGAKLVVAKPDGHKDRTYLIDIVVAERVTTMHFVPSMLQLFLDDPKVSQCGKSLRRVICSGEALPYSLKETFFSKLDAELYNLYGPTEAAVDVTFFDCAPDPAGKFVPIGRPVANTQIYLLDPYLQPVPIGVAGELHIGGVQVGKGYLKRPELTAEKFIADPFAKSTDAKLYKTGDLARYADDGSIVYLGRLDHQVKLRGLRIELGEIESVLDSHAGVKEAVVSVFEGEDQDKRLVGYVVPQRDYEAVSKEADDRVEQVQTIFDQTYFQDAATVDPTFNIVGWNSSYTGEAIPESEMRVWVETTVDRILALSPTNVLEMGCGTGMLLFRVAPACEHYIGADFSHVALEQLRELLSQPDYARSNVELLQRPADDYTGLASKAIDTIVINSVVQLFPSIDYLVEVIAGALDHLQPGGKMFIGDVRSKNHLLAYHASVETFRATSSTSCSHLLERIKRRADLEEELLIEPAFFYALRNRYPQISDVEIQLKRGDFQNELTRFRYDVTLTVAADSYDPADPATIPWSDIGDLEGLAKALSSGDVDGVLVTGIPNARLSTEAAILDALVAPDKPEDVGDLRDLLQQTPHNGVEPESVWEMCSSHGHAARIRWSISHGDFCFDALIVRTDNPQAFRFPSISVAPNEGWNAFANDPLIGIQARNLVPELRSFLKEKLPDYMVPAAFVVMDEFPLSPNGKVDRKRLPAADFGSPEVSGDYVAPRNETEELLCAVWSDVLGLSRVGVHDNFFDVGGDSILNIQVVSRAAKVGIRLTPLQLFKHQTIAELATAAQSTSIVEAEQGAVTGSQRLSPMQHWVIDKAPADLNRSNQIVCFSANRRLNSTIVSQVVKHLTEHHDALRLGFAGYSSGGSIEASYSDEVSAECFESVEIDGSSGSNATQKQLDGLIDRISGSLSVEGGPLWKIAQVNFSNEDRCNVLFCLHHLVADGFSSRILAEDFAAMYLQLDRDEEIALPRKTTSFQAAGERMAEYANSQELRRELAYWQGLSDPNPCELPTDLSVGNDDEESELTVSTSLTVEMTDMLLKDAAKAYRSRVNELLIAALARVLCRWAGKSAIQMETEGHGREDIFEDFDLSRTVGVFAAMFPIHIEVDPDAPVSKTVRSVKSQFRTIPSHGLGYGFLRYLGSTEERDMLASLPAAEILFNYLGQYDQSGAQSELFGSEFYLDTSDRARDEIRTHTLDVITWVVGGQLNIRWTYSGNRHERQTVQQLSDEFVNEIQALVRPGRQAIAPATTDDFPLVSISEADLQKITTKIPSAEKIYPLTPLQEGMLFHALYEPNSDVYYVQLNGRLAKDLDAAAFGDAWRSVVARHDIFRTHFLADVGARALQVVSTQCELDFKTVDISTLEKNAIEARLNEARNARRDGYSIEDAPLMSVRIYKTQEANYLFWNFHHLLLDGASMVATVEEVFRTYQKRQEGNEIDTTQAEYQFGDFVAWRENQSEQAAREFWSSHMSGVASATSLPGANSELTEEVADFRKLSFQLQSDESDVFRDRIKQKRLTPNTLVHGAWGLLLGASSLHRPVIFGSVVPGRSPQMPGSEAVIGLCMNTLPVAITMRPDDSVSEWLSGIQATLVEMREFDYFPLVDIQRCSAIPSGTPMFESVIAVQGYLGKHSSLTSWASSFGLDELEFIDWNDLPLSLAVEVGETVDVVLKYKTSVISDTAASNLREDLQLLLRELPKAMDNTVESVLSILTAFRLQRAQSQKQSKRATTANQLRRIRRKRVSD